ncbi:hypothetical protein [Phocaeicola vulgatus]|uniref:hypothetical protein n=1 Tax=Phocaeicola vulgatus TaxID=821 RepID=UPI0005192560|nr:hypothetical protein [Phocaeicola vulgatus]
MKIVKFGTAALIAFVGCVLKVCMLIIGLFNFSIVTPTINTIADIISYSLIGYFFIVFITIEQPKLIRNIRV